MKSRVSVTLASALVVLLASTAVMAQPSTWEIGVKAGGTQSKLRGDEIYLFLSQPGLDLGGAVGDYTTGAMWGAYLRRNFSDVFALQVEGLYMEKGGAGTVYGTIDIDVPNSGTFPGDFTGEATVSLDYIEVPVLAVFTFPSDDAGKVLLTASGGVYFATKTKSEIRLQGDATVRLPDLSNRVYPVDETRQIDTVRRYDIGGLIGIGVEVGLSKVRLLFDGRYEFGLVNIDETDERSIWNNTFMLTFGLGFPLGR